MQKAKTGKFSIKAAGGLFPNTRKALETPVVESPQEETQDAAVKSQALKAMLQMLSVGLLAGGGARLLQEGISRFGSKQKSIDSDPTVTLDIHRPDLKTRRLKRAAMESVTDWAPYYPLMFGATGLGLYGGYSGVRAIADLLKKRELTQDLEEARQEFEDALDAQYQEGRPHKYANLQREIDTAYERWLAAPQEKEANFQGVAGGAALGTAALIWLLSHKAAYSRLHKADPEALRKKILSKQRRIRQAIAPPPVVFEFPEEEENEGQDKLAADPEYIPGGKAEGMDAQDLAKKHDVSLQQILSQLNKGIEIEHEHTPKDEVAREIAKDHLEEDPKYYKPHLEDMEEEGKAELELAGPKTEDTHEPTTADVRSILNSIVTSTNLDDKAVHKKYLARGVAPEEGEEVVYSTLQDMLKAHGEEVDPSKIREREPEDDDEGAKAAAVVDHACGSCKNFNGGTCAKQAEVIKAVGEDNLTIYLSNPTKPNSCPFYASENEDKDDQKVEETEEKEAGIGDILSQSKNWLEGQMLNSPALQSQVTQAAKDAAQDPQTLQPAAQALASNPSFQQGVNTGAMKKVQSIPVLGSLFGAK